MQNFDRLEPEQAELLEDIVRAYRARREPIMVIRVMDGEHLQHPGLEGGSRDMQYQDIVALHDEGFIRVVSYDRSGWIGMFTPRAEVLSRLAAVSNYVIPGEQQREQALSLLDEAKRSIDAGDVSPEFAEFVEALSAKIDDIHRILSTEWQSARERDREAERAKEGVSWLRGAVETVKLMGSVASLIANVPRAITNIGAALTPLERVWEILTAPLQG